MRTLAAALLAVLAAAAVPPPARAEGGDKAGHTACSADKERLCAGSDKPGACLEEHRDQLSPECRESKGKMKKHWEGKKGADPMKEACGADMDRLCAGSDKPGMCLHENWDRLSPGCREFKGKMKKHWEAKRGPDPMKTACGGDVERLCPGAPNPGMCLHEHWDELSSGCRDFKEKMKREWESRQGKGNWKKTKGD